MIARPNYPVTAAVLSLALACGGWWSAADESCARPTAAQREEALAAYEAGKALILAEKWDEAAPRFEAAVRIDGVTIPLAHYGLGEARLALKRPAEALAAFLDCRAAYRCLLASPDALADLERMRREEERILRDAVARLEHDALVRTAIKGQEVNRATELPPDEVRRRVHALENRLDEVVRSRGRPPAEPPELAFALGNAYFQSGSPAEAEREFRAALAARPGWGDVHHNLAVVMIATGRVEEAAAEAEAARKAGVPVHPRLLEEIEKQKSARPRPP